MTKLDQFLQRFFVIGLLVLVALVVLVFVVPRLTPSTPPEEPTEVGARETLVGRVVAVLEEGNLDLGDGMSHPYQRLRVRIQQGSLAGEEITVEEGIALDDKRPDAEMGQRIPGVQRDWADVETVANGRWRHGE